MTNEYKYILEKGSKKFPCPECNQRTLVRYIDIDSREYLPEVYGRCDREIKCNYHLNPFKDGFNKINGESRRSLITNIWKNTNNCLKVLINTKPETVYIPNEILKQTLIVKGYEQNVFIQNLLDKVAFPFGPKDIEKIIAQYYLGTVCNGYRTGAITFPFIDIQGHTRAIQVKKFDQNNHTIGTDFLHSIIEKHFLKKKEEIPDWLRAYQNNKNKISCLFGEHLLSKYPLNPIALVEAPKTAIYGTLYFGFPDNPANLIWLGVYNLSSLSFEKCKVLKDRRVYLFPDLSKDGKAFELWTNKSNELRRKIPGLEIKVSELLERNGGKTERKKGFDLADYLIKLDWRKFRSEFEDQKSDRLQYEQIKANPTAKIISDLRGENGEKSEALETNYFCGSIPAYSDNDGRLFIETPLGRTFTVYPSIDYYNQRLGIPTFQYKNQIDKSILKEVWIDPQALKIKN